jgi:signal transduction histidine kinase
MGISPDVVERIWGPLFAKGIGLGLYFVRNAVDAHGGDVDFISELGKGTTFTITLSV